MAAAYVEALPDDDVLLLKLAALDIDFDARLQQEHIRGIHLADNPKFGCAMDEARCADWFTSWAESVLESPEGDEDEDETE